jgi:Holliday junction resolvase RusA-like endonuclease
MMIVWVEPMGAPRQTQRDKWAKRPVIQRYHSYRDKIRAEAGHLSGCGEFTLIFMIQMPASWSKKKKRAYDGKPHQQKPDADNLAKGVLDAICQDDAHVWSLKVEKFWCYGSGSIGIKAE